MNYRKNAIEETKVKFKEIKKELDDVDVEIHYLYNNEIKIASLSFFGDREEDFRKFSDPERYGGWTGSSRLESRINSFFKQGYAKIKNEYIPINLIQKIVIVKVHEYKLLFNVEIT